MQANQNTESWGETEASEEHHKTSEEHHVVQYHEKGLAGKIEDWAGTMFIMPAVLTLLFLSIFPLIVSFYLSLSRFKIAKGGFTLDFVGLANYKKLLVGRDQTHFLGQFAPITLVHWLVFGIIVMALAIYMLRYLRGANVSSIGVLGRMIFVAGFSALAWLLISTSGPGGRLGSLMVTQFYVLVGITIQFILGLTLAMLTVQKLPGRRFFRVVFLLPMMITPVGVAYMFRMVTDTGMGPFTPAWQIMGMADFSWVTSPWGARIAILLADTWQWTPFMFIVLLAALESQSVEVIEAATVDGANRWQIFRNITWFEILPVSLTLILIRMIEGFKIIDLPQVMTNGGPGTATESLTLQSFIAWRSLDLGSSAAVAYMLLTLVTFIGVAFASLVRQNVLKSY